MDLQAEYDNSIKVPNFLEITQGWQRDAEAFRATWPHATLGLPYGTSERQAIDIFRPSAAPAPMALFIHGGYWQRMHRHAFSHFAAGLLAHGIAVAIPSYDLCPTVSMAEIVAQIRKAAAALLRQGTGPLVATGHSAGGHLSAMLLATDWPALGLPPGSVKSALPISGLFDLPPLLHTTLATPLGMDEAEAIRLSPAFMPSPGLPIHAVVGGKEGPEYERQSRDIATAWSGIWEVLEGHDHFTIAAELINPDSALTKRAAAMVRA